MLLAVPASRRLLVDSRATALTAGELALRALVLIPVGTVAFEELAFRGAARCSARCGARRTGPAVATASAVFGLWHVRSAAAGLAANGSPGGLTQVGLVGAAVVGTGAAGAVFCGLRLRTGSLLAPAGLHAAVNGLGLLAAAVAGRVGG